MGAARLALAQEKLAEARSAIDRLAIGTDDRALDAGLAHRRACEDKAAALEVASTRIAAERTAIEAEIAKVIDDQTRAATAASVSALVEKWITQEAEFVAAAQRLEATSREAGLICMDAHGTSAFLKSTREQIPPAGAVVVALLKQYAAGVLAGQARATLPRSEASAPKLTVVAPPAVPTQNVFITKNLKYANAQGVVTCLGKFKRYDLPEALALEALSSGAALPLTDERIRGLAYNATPFEPDPSACAWLGTPPPAAAKKQAAPKSAVDPILSSYFEPSDYGKQPTKTFTMPVTPTPDVAGARRSQPDEE